MSFIILSLLVMVDKKGETYCFLNDKSSVNSAET